MAAKAGDKVYNGIKIFTIYTDLASHDYRFSEI